MSEVLASLKKKGGGGVPVASGTFSRSTSAVTINCGFRPKKIFIIHGDASSLTVANGETRLLYDSDWSTTNIASDYVNASGVKQITKASITDLLTISDTGFTLTGTTSIYQGTCYYTAIGE